MVSSPLRNTPEVPAPESDPGFRQTISLEPTHIFHQPLGLQVLLRVLWTYSRFINTKPSCDVTSVRLNEQTCSQLCQLCIHSDCVARDIVHCVVQLRIGSAGLYHSKRPRRLLSVVAQTYLLEASLLASLYSRLNLFPELLRFPRSASLPFLQERTKQDGRQPLVDGPISPRRWRCSSGIEMTWHFHQTDSLLFNPPYDPDVHLAGIS